MPTALDEITRTYSDLRKQSGMLNAASQTPEQQQALSAQFKKAEENYYQALAAGFADNDAEVASLTAQLAQANTRIEGFEAELGNISKVIDTVTQIVGIGTSLLSKCAAA